MFKFLPLIFKNVLRNRRRSSLTIASIAISLCLLGLLTALYASLFSEREVQPARAVRIVTRHKVSLTQPFPDAYMQKIAQIPGVASIMHQHWYGGIYKEPKNMFARFAVDPPKFFGIHYELKIPEDQRKAFETQRTGCIAEKGLATKYGWKLGERINLTGDIYPVDLDLTLVGIFEDPEKFEVMYFNWDYLKEGLSPGRKDFAALFYIKADDSKNVTRITKDIDALFANSQYPTKSESESEFIRGFLGFLGNIKMILFGICGAVTFTILLVSGNTISMSVRERVREVGVMKTLGYSSRAIMAILLSESIFISILGGVIGLLLAEGLCTLVRNMGIPIDGLQRVGMTFSLASLNILLAILIGFVSAIIPALSASRTTIVNSLRYAG